MLKEQPFIIEDGRDIRAIATKRKTSIRVPVEMYEMPTLSLFLEENESRFLYDNPFGPVGTYLWIKEQAVPYLPIWEWHETPEAYRCPEYVLYKSAWDDPTEIIWLPADTMPRWASSILLKIENIEIDYLQNITYGDCIKEGLDMVSDVEYKPGWDISKFINYWNSKYSDESVVWEANPRVWIISFILI